MEGWEGWDDYAPFYDWENARTLGRRDVPFWERLARQTLADRRRRGNGCWSSDVEQAASRFRSGAPACPLSASIDPRRCWRERRSAGGRRSESQRPRRAEKRLARRLASSSCARTFATCRSATDRFPLVIAPYGILQSLLRERDLAETLDAVARVVRPGGMFGLELVADLPSWQEYSRRVSLRGRRSNGADVKLIESVRQDRRRKLTLFDQEFVERRDGHVRRRQFTLSFRTLTVRQMRTRLEKAGFEVTALLGDYQGGPWDERADAWIILARNEGAQKSSHERTKTRIMNRLRVSWLP